MSMSGQCYTTYTVILSYIVTAILISEFTNCSPTSGKINSSLLNRLLGYRHSNRTYRHVLQDAPIYKRSPRFHQQSHNRYSSYTSLTPNRFQESKLVFPKSPSQQWSANSINKRVRGKPDCAGGGAFCEHVDNYPTQKVLKAIEADWSSVKEFFHKESPIMARKHAFHFADNEVGGESLCPARLEVSHPRRAENTETDEWQLILNLPQQGYIQQFKFEKCLTEGKECSVIGSHLPHYTTECKQKFIVRHLVALNDQSRAVAGPFRLPGCCSCHLRRNTRITRRDVTAVRRKNTAH